MTGSNRRPPACKAGALPAELIPQDSNCLKPDLVGLVGLEPTTPALSRRCSNQLSYRPAGFTQEPGRRHQSDSQTKRGPVLLLRTTADKNGRKKNELLHFQKGGDPAAPSDTATLLRLHPSHEPCRGNRPPLQVRLTTSGRTRSHGVTGGVYKTRERIHRDILIHDY